MQTELKLPPCGRDFQVYERVVVQTASTREVAKEFSLSQTRVRQIVKRVAQWLLQELPTASEAADAAHLRLSQHMAADRLEGLFCEAMTGWRARHETKYFGLALRVITKQGKMPVIAGTLAGLMADAIEGPLPEERSDQPADYTPAPPEEDCSPATKNEPAAAISSAEQPATTPDNTMTSVPLVDDVRAARRAFFGPAQQPAAEVDDEPVTQLQITPKQAGVRIERPLSRRERRRRARLGA